MLYLLGGVLMLLSAFGDIFHPYIDRYYTTYLGLSVIIMYYYLKSANEDYLYMFSFVFTFVGLANFNFSVNNLRPTGILFYAFGIAIYLYKVILDTEVFSIKKVFTYVLPSSVILMIVMFFLLKNIEEDLFLIVLFYAMTVSFLLYLSILKYTTKPILKNRWLLLSGVMLTVSTIISGYDTFIEYAIYLRVTEVITFNLGHLFMAMYMIELSHEHAKNNSVNIVP